MLDGFVPFPADFAQRYRDQGYWRDQSLAQEFAAVFATFGPRTALIDGARRSHPTPTSTASPTTWR